MKRRVTSISITVTVLTVASCSLYEGGSGEAPTTGVSPGPEAGGAPITEAPGSLIDAQASVDANVIGGECASGESFCSAFDTRTYCAPSPGGLGWASEKCARGCFRGACSTTQCTDECAGAFGTTGKCRLWDMTTASFVSAMPTTSLHDRARTYDGWLRDRQMPTGGVVNAFYTDATFGTIDKIDGTVDSALWTGTALAAQGFRFLATGAPDAATRVREIATDLHRSLAISGAPGYLARFVVEEGSPFDGVVDCSGGTKHHCNATLDGKTYRWKGHTSRDQYTGVMLGLYAGYLATTDVATRDMIRADVLTIVEELMKQRVVPAHVEFQGVPIDVDLTIDNVILAPDSEMDDGRVYINLDVADQSGQVRGAREFLTDFNRVGSQLPLVGPLAPSVPRPDSAIMLGAFFRIALLVTDGVPSMAARRQAILDYYASHVDSWIATAKGWTYLETCGDAYYGIHIGFIMAYVWGVLEDDPGRRANVRDAVVHARGWNTIKDHKNPYLTFMWAATRPMAPSVELTDAVELLSQFPAGPRVNRPTDRVADYEHDPSCSDGDYPQASKSIALDVGERVVVEFMWQRNPWGLFSAGHPLEVFPGVDFTVAYWLARHHRFVEDDRTGVCARRVP